jgi:hypothetical protein
MLYYALPEPGSAKRCPAMPLHRYALLHQTMPVPDSAKRCHAVPLHRATARYNAYAKRYCSRLCLCYAILHQTSPMRNCT